MRLICVNQTILELIVKKNNFIAYFAESKRVKIIKNITTTKFSRML